MVNSIKKQEIAYFIVTILVSSLFIVFDRLNLLNWFKRPLEKIINPIKIAKTELYKKAAGLNINPDFNSLVEQNKLLEKENAELKVKQAELMLETASQKKLLQAPLSPSWKFIPARVTGVTNGIMTINQGADSQVKKNQIVVSETSLIGRVESVTPNQAKIILPESDLSQIKADILPAYAKGIVKSEMNKLVLDQVLSEVNLNPGQVVATSGDDVFPPALVIGKISTVIKKETAVYQQAVLEPIVDYSSLKMVFIISNFP